MVEFLSRHHFDVVVTELMNWNDVPLIRAAAGACQMAIAEATPDGWNQRMIRDLALTKVDRFVVYRGMIYHDRPTWLTVTHYWWHRYLRRLGLAEHEMPVLAVMATASCNAEGLPWAEIAALGCNRAGRELRACRTG
jgi:hypothetical protein